ncbi:MAG: aminodeoxychorismate/anthranilate synthase component II [Fervidicoccaceae archaeon]
MGLVLIVDNYDSFVYNIAQYVAELGWRPVVLRNDEITPRAAERMRPDKIIVSPGPGSPENPRDVGFSPHIVARLGPRIPILGVCLGHQIIGVVFGARARRARRIMHGKSDVVRVVETCPIFYGLPREFEVMRYHSLVVDDLPSHLIATAVSATDGEIMGLRHAVYPIFGVQFHPESVGTPRGKRILKNFLELDLEL